MRCILFFFLSMFGLAAHAIPMISLNPSSTIFGFNDSFTVDVFVSGVEIFAPLVAFGFDVGVDTGLTHSGATVAPPFFDDSGFFPTTDVAGSTFPAVSGDGILLATLALNTGTSEGIFGVSVFTTPGDFGSSEGLFTFRDTYGIDDSVSVTVARGSVPLPSSLALLAAGLAGFAYRRVRDSKALFHQ